jgi:hypothetical protein
LGLFSILSCAHLPNWTQSGHSFFETKSLNYIDFYRFSLFKQETDMV